MRGIQPNLIRGDQRETPRVFADFVPGACSASELLTRLDTTVVTTSGSEVKLMIGRWGRGCPREGT